MIAAAPRDAVDRTVRAVLIGVFVVAALVAPSMLSASNLYLLSAGLAYSLAVLSLVVLVGLVGQFSLAQAAFMGVGALTAGHLVSDAHVPFLLAVPLGGLAAVPIGMVAALPALRVRGVYLAVATLSFGQALDTLFFHTAVNGGSAGGGVPLPRPAALSGAVGYYWFELAVLLGCIAFVCMMRSRRSGRNLAAVRDSEAAALSVGISVVWAKVGAFALSAFIAGVAGVLYAGLSEVASGASFSSFDSISLLAVGVIGGLGSAAGAVIAGVLKTMAPVLIAKLPGVASAGELVGVVFGAGLVLQMMTAPLGIASKLLDGERALAARVRTAVVHRQRAAADRAAEVPG
ncbi:MAG TPA: branched-chain amino acid ABC transporter permease [Candidatus Dormibacteraeota bacterium]|nr:branched-chain amino acid ABC transporter permease [Candidatus Dormibacteraeota bacterium]